MTELLRIYLKYIGFKDCEIEELDEAQIRFHAESKEFEYFSAGYEKGEEDNQCLNCYVDYEEEIAELEEEIAGLKDGTILKELTEKCKQQAEQIEKMKCCGNCKHEEFDANEEKSKYKKV